MEFDAPPTTSWKRWLTVVPLVLGGLGAAAGAFVVAAPARVSYTIAAGELSVQADLGPLALGRETPLSAIGGARREALHGARRVSGTSRWDFCQGDWRFTETGPAWVAGTCVADTVVLDVGQERWVLTPAEPEAFLSALYHGGGTFPAAANLTAPRGPELLVLLVVLLPVLALLPWLGWRAARPLLYTLEGGTLSVPGTWRDATLDVRGATFAVAPLGRAWKIAGTALPGLLLGGFRAGGRTVHVAARDAKSGVLITGKRALYVTPADVDGFCRALVDAGATRVP